MREYRTVLVDGIKHTVLISDEQEALLAAQAAGRAVLGLWDPKKPQDAPWGIPFLAEKEVPVDPDFLERAVRRQKGLPWMISRTKRLTLREFQESDWDGAAEFQKEKDCPEAFSGREAFRAYIRNQYGFYQYGIWAVIENETGSLAGAAGVWDMSDKPAFLSCSEGDRDSFLELGYWIRRPFRMRGLGREAAAAAAAYALENLTEDLYVRIRRGNLSSRKLAESLGFSFLPGQEALGHKKEKNEETVLLFHGNASLLSLPNRSK